MPQAEQGTVYGRFFCKNHTCTCYLSFASCATWIISAHPRIRMTSDSSINIPISMASRPVTARHCVIPDRLIYWGCPPFRCLVDFPRQDSPLACNWWVAHLTKVVCSKFHTPTNKLANGISAGRRCQMRYHPDAIRNPDQSVADSRCRAVRGTYRISMHRNRRAPASLCIQT